METDSSTAAKSSLPSDALRFGPSPYMVAGGLCVHPLLWIGVIWAAFSYSTSFRAFLWKLNFAPWRKLLLSVWDYTYSHPHIWLLLPLVALGHLVIRYTTSYFALNQNYLFIQTGLFSFGSPGGPLRVFNDPIPFSTVIDANAQKGLLGLITGTGTLFVKTSEVAGYIKLHWVPKVEDAQAAILAKAGVKDARILSSLHSR